MTAAAALVWIAVLLRRTIESTTFSTDVSFVFERATFDIAVMGIAVSAAQTMLVAARLDTERAAEAKIFGSLGVGRGPLMTARILELWAQSAFGACIGILIAITFWVVGEGWRGTGRDVLVATAAALLVPLVAVIPTSLWTWWRLSRPGSGG